MAATPKGQKLPRCEVFVGQRPAPDIEGMWLVELALQCGLASTSNMNISPVPWVEINAWSDATGWTGSWIKLVIRELSISYIKMYKDSENPATESPIEMDLDEQRSIVAGQFQRFISSRG